MLSGKVTGSQFAMLPKNKLHHTYFLVNLPFTDSYLSQKRVRILKSNINYITRRVLLFICSCCRWYIWLIYDWHFTEQGWIAWIDSTCFQVRSTKNKRKHGKHSVEVHNGQYLKRIWKIKDDARINCFTWYQYRDSYIFALLKFNIVIDIVYIVFFLLVLLLIHLGLIQHSS